MNRAVFPASWVGQAGKAVSSDDNMSAGGQGRVTYSAVGRLHESERLGQHIGLEQGPGCARRQLQHARKAPHQVSLQAQSRRWVTDQDHELGQHARSAVIRNSRGRQHAGHQGDQSSNRL